MATTLVRKVMLKIAADDGDTESRIDKISRKADELAAKHPDLKVRIDSAAASAKLAVLRKELKDTGTQSDESKASLGGLGRALNTTLLGGISGGIGQMSMFDKAIAGMGVATGLAEPLMAGLTVVVGGLASGLVAGGLGLGVFGLLAKSQFTTASTAAGAVQTAQDTYNASLKAGVKQATAYTAEQKAINLAYAELSPAQVKLSKQIGNAQNAWQSFVQSNTAGVATVMNRGIGLLPKVFASMQPFLAPTEKALSGLVSQMGKGMSSSGFKSWISDFAKASGPNITNLGGAIGHIVVGIGGVLKAFLPMATTMTGGLDRITAKFATWGTTLSGHSGFKSLMAMFKSDTPVVVGLLKNLAGIIKTVAGQMTGMSTPANSRTLIQVAEALSGLVNNLLKAHPQLVAYILYAKMGADASKQLFGGIKSVSDAAKGISNFSAGFSDSKKAADEATGAAGTYGGQISKVLQKLGLMKGATAEVTGATEAETGAQTELDGAMDANPIGLIILAIAGLVIAFVELWKHSAAFRDFWKAAWRDIRTAAVDAWHFLDNDALKPLMSGIDKTLSFIRGHWKLLAAIILGPLGLIIDALATHWSAVEHGFEAAWKFVAGIVSKGVDFVKDVVEAYVKLEVKIFETGWDAVKAVFKAAWGFIRPFVDMEVRGVKNILAWFGRLGRLFLGWWDDAAHAVGVGVGKLVGFVRRLPGMVNSALGGLPGMMYRAGIHAIENLIDGMKSQGGHLGSVMLGFASKAAGFFGLSPAKEGPLSAGGAPYIRGQHFALDIAAGMSAALPAVHTSATAVARAAGISGAAYGHPGYGAAGAGGAQKVQLELNITGGNQAFRTFLKKSIRTTGGDVGVVGA